jgi:hypothetical protein
MQELDERIMVTDPEPGDLDPVIAGAINDQPFTIGLCLASDRDRLADIIDRASEALLKVDLANLDYHDDGASVVETTEAIREALAILAEATRDF